MAEATFTWVTPDGKTYQVEPVTSVDDWTGRELRAIQRLSGGNFSGLGRIASGGLVYSLSAARVVPGLTIDAADATLTVRQIAAIQAELNEQYAAEAAAAAEAEPDAVLSPTRPASGDEPEAQTTP